LGIKDCGFCNKLNVETNVQSFFISKRKTCPSKLFELTKGRKGRRGGKGGKGKTIG